MAQVTLAWLVGSVSRVTFRTYFLLPGLRRSCALEDLSFHEHDWVRRKRSVLLNLDIRHAACEFSDMAAMHGPAVDTLPPHSDPLAPSPILGLPQSESGGDGREHGRGGASRSTCRNAAHNCGAWQVGLSRNIRLPAPPRITSVSSATEH